MRALDKKLMRNLWQIRGQAFAISLVVAAAVATLVLSSGTYRSLELTRNLYYDENHFADIFGNVKRAPENTILEIKNIPGVKRVQTAIRQYALLDMDSVLEPVRAIIVSLPPGKAALNIPVLRSGTWPLAGHDDQVLVHESFAEGHNLRPGDTIDATINGKKRKLHISGIALSPEFIYAIGPGDLVPDNKRFGILWMNRDALAAAANLEGAFNDISLKLDPAINPDAVIEALDAITSRYGGTGAYARKDQISDSFIDSELKQLKTMTRVIPPIFIITATFLLNIAVGRLVETERGQIGLLKAIGYTDFSIGAHYLRTALAITIFGIALGWIAGLWMGHGMTQLYIQYYKFPVLRYQITADVFMGAALISIIAATAGAIMAIRKAVTIPPAIAMAPPPPPIYRPGIWEKAGFLRGVTPSGRMVVRHIARWPLRSSFTVLGIAMSIALLLATANFSSVVDTMLESFFSRNNKQDVTISFTEIRSNNAAHEISRLPGAIDVELSRNVPARIISGHLEKRVAIMGIDANSELNHPLDIHGNKILLPARGIVLNERLADYLNIAPGNNIKVKVLDGRMPELVIPVTGISREYVGLTAYMNREALNRALRDGPVANTAVVLIDEERQKEFYTKIKNMPYIAGVTSQNAARELFRKMIEENILVIVGFYVIFASALAFGVIYNNARLTLTERSREFSLLRVLGFHQGEVAWILGGEIALLTFLALPLGCLLGYGLVALITTAMSSDLYRMPFTVAPSIYGHAVIAILIAASISTVLVLYRLSELDLLSVLKERE